MYYITTTRFNENTWNQNKRYREKTSNKGCIYGSPVVITPVIPVKGKIFVIEMNNEINKIEGIGYIIKPDSPLESRQIYKNGNYNRYVYVGEYRIDRNMIKSENDIIVIEVLEKLLFKGRKHNKRGKGISLFPSWLEYNKYNFSFVNYFKKIFKEEYGEDVLKKSMKCYNKINIGVKK